VDGTILTGDGLRLQLRDWPVAGARGTVALVHGLGEHVGRYLHLAAQLNAWGWTVVGYDQRGHGASEGARGRIPTADALLDDLGRVLAHVRDAHAAPVVLLGHSLGGLVAARFVAEGLAEAPGAWYRAVDGLVLSSPALDPGMNAGQRLLLAVLGPLAPTLAVANGLKPAWISRDAAVVSAYASDVLVHDRVTPRLVRFIVDEGERVRALAPRWRVPTLLLYAEADRCVAPAGSAAFAAAAPAGMVTTVAYPGLYHEIFNEPERARVFDDLHRWLDARAAGEGARVA
jgi:alpha-beta hydrolase superfamily lysophospholipase